jgi:hypothetical protein
MAQTQLVQRITREAFKNLIHTLLFTEAFPNSVERTEFSKDALFKAAKELRIKTIAKRLSSDENYVNVFAKLVSSRSSSLTLVLCLLLMFRSHLAFRPPGVASKPSLVLT